MGTVLPHTPSSPPLVAGLVDIGQLAQLAKPPVVAGLAAVLAGILRSPVLLALPGRATVVAQGQQVQAITVQAVAGAKTQPDNQPMRLIDPGTAVLGQHTQYPAPQLIMAVAAAVAAHTAIRVRLGTAAAKVVLDIIMVAMELQTGAAAAVEQEMTPHMSP